MTVHFYSPRAYRYIREQFRNLVPHPSTLRTWYKVVDGSPGFTKQAFDAIKLKCCSKKIVCNLVIDEMSIKEEIVYQNRKSYGYTDLGNGTVEGDQSDNGAIAKNALVFMAVSINDGWKVRLGYFLILSLNGQERASLLRRCLQLLNETGVTVNSITFDGAACNINMCTYLGASFDYYNEFKPYFINPYNNETIFVFFDPCHMIKLVRNCLGDRKVLLDKDHKKIEWKYFEELLNVQNKEGMHCANKIRRTHIHFTENKMKVSLAVQVLSESVKTSFLFLK